MPQPSALHLLFPTGPRARFFSAVLCLGLLTGPSHLARAADPVAPTIALFNGHNLDGWTRFTKDNAPDGTTTWSAVDGVLTCSGKPVGYLRTEQKFKNFHLSLEWRWSGPAPVNAQGKTANRNSSLLLHLHTPDMNPPRAIEAQVMETNAGDLVFFADAESTELLAARAKAISEAGEDAEKIKRAQSLRRLSKKLPSSEKPIGEWNRYEVVSRDGNVTLTVNGVVQNSTSGLNLGAGHIGLHSEGAEVQFRNLQLEPLP